MTPKLAMLLGLALAVSSSPALAATIDNLSGQSCGEFEGTWHFVQNQIPGGYGPGTLTAVIGGDTCTATGQPVGKGQVQHFYCIDYSGQLTAANTGSLPGKLVLSGFECAKKECSKVEICGNKVDDDCDGTVDEKDCVNP